MTVPGYMLLEGEIDLGRLVGTLLRIAIEHAGAERGVLLVERDGEAWVQGEGSVDSVEAHLHALRRLDQCDRLPQGICNSVRHTMESVLLDDAGSDHRHGADPYVARWRPRSVMCAPVLNQRRLVGVLYLENNLATGVFTPDRLRLIQILASQAAVPLVNAQLYEVMRQEIEERKGAEQKLRAIARGTASVAAGDFFTSLVQHLASALGLRYALLSECVDQRRSRVRTLAYWNGDFGENFAFDLEGTPCRYVIDGELSVFPENLQSLFPADVGLVDLGAESYLGIPVRSSAGDILGHLAVMDDKPFHPKDVDIEILKIFGARAGTELERKRAEDALRASELRYSTLAEAVPDILFTTRADGYCDYTSRRFQEYSGLTADEALGDGWVRAVHPEDRAHTANVWLEAVRTGRPYQIEYRLRRADGDYRWFRGQAIPMRNRAGEIVQWFGACADIHDLKELKNRLEVENVYLQERIDLEHGFEEIIGRSPPLMKVLQQIERVAPADTTVLITGETGTGKELVARAIHKLSPRRDRAMITVNCGAISPGLVESELFGHEKGSFTGAIARKIGRFELADGGAIFLDEIGDLALDLQVKLLRMLQEGEIERVGGEGPIKVNVRVIAATHKDLEEAVAAGRFRADLYYRLNVFPIRTPALRERTKDIPPLVRYLVKKYSTKLGKPIHSIPKAALDALIAYSWPGNVRELANILERSVIVSRGTTLELGEWLTASDEGAGEPDDLDRTLHQVTRQRILEALEETGWRVSGPRGAARLLGLKPTTLEARMRRLDIRRPKADSG